MMLCKDYVAVKFLLRKQKGWKNVEQSCWRHSGNQDSQELQEMADRDSALFTTEMK